MSTVHICLKDIFDVAVACNVIFYPEDTPFFSGSALAVSGAHSILIDADGTGSVTLLPGRYTVRFAKITGNTDTLIILVPTGDGVYELKDLICAGNWVLPLRDLLQVSKNLSDVADPAAAFAAIKQSATASTPGAVQLATQAEVDAGTDAAKALTPATLQNAAKWGTKADSSKLPKYLTVANAAERLTLTSAQVNVGDAVRQLDEMTIWIVVEPDKLGTEDAFNSWVEYAQHANEAGMADSLNGDGTGYTWDAFALAQHAANHGKSGTDPVAIDASQVTTGTFDVARIPVLPSQTIEISSGNLTALTTAQQTAIVKGSVVTTTDGNRWVYVGSGDKTLAANYIQLADITPDWSVIANKPTLGTASAQDASAFATAAQGVLAGSALQPNGSGAQLTALTYEVHLAANTNPDLTLGGVPYCPPEFRITLPIGRYRLRGWMYTVGNAYATVGNRVTIPPYVISGSITATNGTATASEAATILGTWNVYSSVTNIGVGGSWYSTAKNAMYTFDVYIQVTSPAVIGTYVGQYAASSVAGNGVSIGASSYMFAERVSQ